MRKTTAATLAFTVIVATVGFASAEEDSNKKPPSTWEQVKEIVPGLWPNAGTGALMDQMGKRIDENTKICDPQKGEC